MTFGYDPESPPTGSKPHFPPLLRGVEMRAGTDPFDKACADAGTGRAETGDLYWSPDADVLRAAIVFNPEQPLTNALPILFALANGLNDCLGALAPPEVGVSHVWPDGIKLNGALCGTFQIQASTEEPDETPEWMVIGLALARISGLSDPGAHPHMTALAEEGCADISSIRLLESWSRHTLVWINRWSDDGYRPIFEAWLARADGRAETVTLHGRTGLFLGLDEQGGLLLKTETGPETLSLRQAVADPRRWPPNFPPGETP